MPHSPPPATLASPAPGARLLPPVRVSRRHSRYLESADSRPYVPVGLNLCFVRFEPDPEVAVGTLTRWLVDLAAAGGNFARFWLGHPMFDLEPGPLGRFDEAAARRLQRVLDLCALKGIRVKLTLDHFRFIDPEPVAESFPGAASFARPAWHEAKGGPARTMDDFWQTPACRAAYRRKLDWLAERFSGHPAVLAWELWNEVNACRGAGWEEWSREMLGELRRRFPDKLTLQSLGSYDDEAVEPAYRWLATLPGNDLVQAHRYVDLGASLTVCRGPLDVLVAEAMGSLRAMAPGRPVLLAESGAVEPGHSGPFRLYAEDVAGTLLHDLLFAPFFAGAAGTGQAWHWDFYVVRQALWWHFTRFQRAIEGFDPIAEQAEPEAWETPILRIRALRGRRTTLLWCRDRASDWRTELAEGRSALVIGSHTLSWPPESSWRSAVRADFYDPWTDHWTPVPITPAGPVLPAFRRSGILRLWHPASAAP